MPRRVKTKKNVEASDPLPKIEDENDELIEDEEVSFPSPVKKKRARKTRSPKKMSAKDDAERRYGEFAEEIGDENNSILESVAPDLVLKGYFVTMQMGTCPAFGEPVTATLTLEHECEDECDIDPDEPKISVTIATKNIVQDAPYAVVGLVAMYYDMTDDEDVCCR